MLNGAFFPVGQLHGRLSPAHARTSPQTSRGSSGHSHGRLPQRAQGYGRALAHSQGWESHFELVPAVRRPIPDR